MEHNTLVINRHDNVVVVLEDIEKGNNISLPGGENFPALCDIPYGHKIAVIDMKSGSNVYKFGEPIGELKRDVKKGEWVHLHNVLIGEEN